MEVFDPNIPLYQQIVTILKKKIVAEIHEPGTKLPSIRELALQYQVTPNSMQRALQILEDERLIYTERTNGKYVTSDETLIRTLREDILRTNVRTLLQDLFQHGYTQQEIHNALEKEMMNYGR